MCLHFAHSGAPDWLAVVYRLPPVCLLVVLMCQQAECAELISSYRQFPLICMLCQSFSGHLLVYGWQWQQQACTACQCTAAGFIKAPKIQNKAGVTVCGISQLHWPCYCRLAARTATMLRLRAAYCCRAKASQWVLFANSTLANSVFVEQFRWARKPCCSAVRLCSLFACQFLHHCCQERQLAYRAPG